MEIQQKCGGAVAPTTTTTTVVPTALQYYLIPIWHAIWYRLWNQNYNVTKVSAKRHDQRNFTTKEKVTDKGQ